MVALGTNEPHALAMVGATFGLVLTVVMAVLALSGGLSITAGIGLVRGKGWGDLLAIIASVLHIANFPVGTIVGGLSLYVLLVREPRPASVPQRDSQPTF